MWLAPLVPGSCRGILFILLILLVALGSFLAARLVHSPAEPPFGDDDPTQLTAICVFALGYCLVPATFARRWPQGAPRFVRLVGLTLSGLGRVQEAVTCFEEALKINPKHAEAWFRKGLALRSLGRASEGDRCLENARAMDRRITKADT